MNLVSLKEIFKRALQSENRIKVILEILNVNLFTELMITLRVIHKQHK